MRSIIAIAALLPVVLAWNDKICNGAGGCVGTAWNNPHPFRCPNGSLLNIQQSASNVGDAGNGAYEIISKAQFPTSCISGATLAEKDIFIVHTTEFNQKLYMMLRETCTEKNPEKLNCYSKNPNPSTVTLCQVVDASGKQCVMNPRAGECERWGTSAGRDHCKGWTVDEPETPSGN